MVNEILMHNSLATSFLETLNINKILVCRKTGTIGERFTKKRDQLIDFRRVGYIFCAAFVKVSII